MSDETLIAEVRDVCRRWAEAELRGDADELRRLLADDFAGVGPFGFVLDKEQWAGRFASGELVNEAFAYEDVDVRLYGDAAIAIGVQRQQTTFRGQPTPSRLRTTLILVRGKGTWTIAGVHISLMEPPPAPGAPQGGHREEGSAS